MGQNRPVATQSSCTTPSATSFTTIVTSGDYDLFWKSLICLVICTPPRSAAAQLMCLYADRVCS